MGLVWRKPFSVSTINVYSETDILPPALIPVQT